MAGAAETMNLQERLVRYLKTGTEGNFFLPGKNKAFRRFGNVLDVMVEAGQGKEAVDFIKQISTQKLYFKREPLLYFLAVATHSQNLEVKHAAYGIVKDVCENPEDLFTYLKHVKIMAQFTKGWGRGLRRVVCEWYNSREPMQLAEFVTRYAEVEKWSHKDVFRLSHIKPANEGIAFIVKVVTRGLQAAKDENKDPSEQVKGLIDYFDAVKFVKSSDDMLAVAMKLEEHNLYIEHIPTTALTSKEVWNSLLLKMSLRETLAHLAALARRGFLTIPDAPTDQVAAQIREKVLDNVKDVAAVKQEKISPFLIYITIRNYTRVFADNPKKHDRSKDAATQTKRGPPEAAPKDQPKKKKKKKKKGSQNEVDHPEERVGDGLHNDSEASTTENVKKNNPALYDALHAAFRVAVENNLPTIGKRYLLSVKVSVSELAKSIRGAPSITALEVMALMATFLKKKEKTPQLGHFSSKFSMMKFPSEVQDLIQEIGSTACTAANQACDPAAPISWALEHKKKFDVFLIMSDGGETHGDISVAAKLTEYRQKMNLPDAKVVICGLSSPRLDFAKARGMLDIGGFDVSVPTIINQFVTGQLDH